jgi:hypothetical protein
MTAIRDRALVISKTDFAPSGEDHSFIALEIDGAVSRAKIQEIFKAADLELTAINTLGGARWAADLRTSSRSMITSVKKTRSSSASPKNSPVRMRVVLRWAAIRCHQFSKPPKPNPNLKRKQARDVR